jgi:site-specific DNA recombinase
MGKRKKRLIAPDNATVIYARYSSKNQKETSIDAQLRACEEYAQNSGLAIVNRYCDSAQTGRDADRAQFQQMMEDSSKGLFSRVLVHKLDRFARSADITITYIAKLERNGVRLISATETIENTPTGKLVTLIKSAVAQFTVENLATELKKGQVEVAMKAMHLGGMPPLGYIVDPLTRKYAIDEKEAGIVRIIFEKYATGVGYNEILQYLNSMGFRTKKGNEFGKNSLHDLLKNQKYTGRYIYRRRNEEYFDGKRISQINPENKWIVVEEGMPSIIDRALFDKVQEKMAQNRQNAGRYKAKVNYLLSGLIYCGECGSPMQGNTRTDGRYGTKYSSYDCSKKSRRNTCSNRGIRKEHIEDYVVDELYENLFPLASVKRLANMLNDYDKDQSGGAHIEIDLAFKELKDVNVRKQRLVKLVADGIDPDTVMNELKSLEEKARFLTGHIEDMKRSNAVPSISEDMVYDLICQSRDFLKERNVAECRNFIEHYVEGCRSSVIMPRDPRDPRDTSR